MNRGGFSWSRLLGILKPNPRLSRKIGIPLTRSGRERKLGALLGCLLRVLVTVIMGMGILVWIR